MRVLGILRIFLPLDPGFTKEVKLKQCTRILRISNVANKIIK